MVDQALISSVKKPTTDPVQCFETLKNACYKIFQRETKSLSFATLYNTGYNLVALRQSENLYNATIEWYLDNIKQIASKLRPIGEPAALLNDVKEAWININQSIVVMYEALMYLESTWVKTYKKKSTMTIGYEIFLEYVLERTGITKVLQSAVLSEIMKDRIGERVEKTVIKEITKMLMTTSQYTKKKLYDNVEDLYVNETTEYYDIQSQKALSTMSFPDFIAEAEQQIEKEVKRCSQFLDKRTEVYAKCITYGCYINAHANILLAPESAGLDSLIHHQRMKDVERAYKIFIQDPKCGEMFKTALCNVIKSEGGKYLQEYTNAKAMKAENPKQGDKGEYEIKLIDELIAMQEKYKTHWKEQLRKNSSFEITISAAFDSFISSNDSTSDALATYCSEFLNKRANQMTEKEFEHTMDSVLSLFRHIRSKDKFAQFYVHLLANRLLNKKVASDDAERAMITKLKAECGAQYTQKMETMIKDMVLIKEEMEKFTDKYGDLKLDVKILTQGSWPFEARSVICKLPPKLETMCATFNAYYIKRHVGRRINWKFEKSELELIGFLGPTRKRYELSMTTFQGVVLLLFNDLEAVNYKEIAEKTQVPDHIESKSCRKQ